jgi:RNA polymerase sigma-70 factor (ECF subfamily)
MGEGEGGERLSQITTAWTLLHQVHGGAPDEAREAVRLLLVRYRGAVRRYLGRLAGDDADDLAQEFGLALLRGDFRHADPQKGRFRDYVRAALGHLASRHRRRAQKLPRPGLEGDLPLAEVPPDALFEAAWRDELLGRAWAALAQAHPAGHEVLRFRAENPDLSSADMASALAERQGRPLTAEGVRQALHRARERFADLLLDEVAHSLESPTPEALAEELGELGLLDYCRPALGRRP